MPEEQNSPGKETESPVDKHFSLRTLPSHLSDWVWKPVSSSGGWMVDFCRAFFRIVFIVGHEFVRDRVQLRASALTFMVVLAMVPTLALGTAVLKGLGFGGQIRQATHAFLYQLEDTAMEVAPEAHPTEEQAGPPPPAAGSEGQQPAPVEEGPPAASLSGHLHRVVDTVFDYVDKTNFATMGLVGILALLLTVFSVLDSIEKTFNDIWQARSGRPLGKKLIDYLALLVVVPLTINFGVAAFAALKSPDIQAAVNRWLPWLGLKILKVLPVLAVIVAFTILYSFLPNTRVTRKAAVTGGLIGGLGWILLQAVYFKLQILVVRYNAIYGSFAALPLFLLWVYLSWIIFLVGAEVSFGVQIWRRYIWKKMTLTPMGRLGLAFEILAVAAGDYRHRRLTTRARLVWILKQPEPYVRDLLNVLSLAGLLRQVPEEEGYLPAAPLDELDQMAVADLILGEPPPTISPDNPTLAVRGAMRSSLAGHELRERRE